jgi:DNA-directed RNA polymerase specialized sigma24 family protein
MNQEQLTATWAAYLADRTNNALRDKIVEHYFAWAKSKAYGFANHMRIRDKDNAVGDALLKFAMKIVPTYDGVRCFEPYASTCLCRSMLDSLKRDKKHKHESSLDAPIDGESGGTFNDFLATEQSDRALFRESVVNLDGCRGDRCENCKKLVSKQCEIYHKYVFFFT